MTEQSCTCPFTDPTTWTTHYGAIEPGSTQEYDPTCPVHGTLRAEVRKWQAAALRNYDDSTTMQQLKEATDYARDMEDRVRDLEAQVAKVRELHGPRWISLPLPGGFICAECGEPVESEPCATVRALDGDDQ